ncbi:tetratricopeptide repeat protein 19, mitochondrial isoform X1 [Protopterus annectens]|uniref:tetratricopeptide repeat protein 19, mitochondrial isoform X1 n=1 Tax=Protopterus annectens TaxID=7888 RepID=UPI001CFA826F|nr:tetratricopeptide repeat protein 19, mitochondrial isoform X1 [Protopterus annectens]
MLSRGISTAIRAIQKNQRITYHAITSGPSTVFHCQMKQRVQKSWKYWKIRIVTSTKNSNHGKQRGLLGFCLAFSIFKSAQQDEEEAQSAEDRIVLLLKRAKLNIIRGELEDADHILHQAIRLAHQSNNTQAIIYTYDMMANLAFLRGQLSNAEKLFKAAMSYLLGSGVEQDDNAVIEMSLKLASIYGEQNQHELAVHGFEFCIESLESKVEKQKTIENEVLSVEEKANTRLLLGMCLDSYARYLLDKQQLEAAENMYKKSLQISQEVQGESHPQTVVLMNDLATVLDLLGRHSDAYEYVKHAMELARQTSHPELHVVLNNMAGILLHQGHFLQAEQLYQEALSLAKSKGDADTVHQVQEGLQEMTRRKSAA